MVARLFGVLMHQTWKLRRMVQYLKRGGVVARAPINPIASMGTIHRRDFESPRIFGTDLRTHLICVNTGSVFRHYLYLRYARGSLNCRRCCSHNVFRRERGFTKRRDDTSSFDAWIAAPLTYRNGAGQFWKAELGHSSRTLKRRAASSAA
jgi:hypothetical protein